VVWMAPLRRSPQRSDQPNERDFISKKSQRLDSEVEGGVRVEGVEDLLLSGGDRVATRQTQSKPRCEIGVLRKATSPSLSVTVTPSLAKGLDHSDDLGPLKLPIVGLHRQDRINLIRSTPKVLSDLPTVCVLLAASLPLRPAQDRPPLTKWIQHAEQPEGRPPQPRNPQSRLLPATPMTAAQLVETWFGVREGVTGSGSQWCEPTPVWPPSWSASAISPPGK